MIRRAIGTNRKRLLGRKGRVVPEPSQSMTGGILVPFVTTTSWYTFMSPRITRPRPRVMISGCTLNTPTPMPFTVPAIAAARRASTSAGPGPSWPVCVAMMNAAMEATVPTDRSMPPVSMARVWLAPRSASGTAARIVEPTQAGLIVPGDAISSPTTSSTSSPVSGMSGRSRRSRRHPPATRTARPQGPSRPGRSRSGPPHREEAAEHDDADEDRALDHGRQVRIRAEQGQVRPDEGEHEHRHDRSGDASPTARETDAAEDDRRDAEQRVGTRDRRADAGASR